MNSEIPPTRNPFFLIMFLPLLLLAISGCQHFASQETGPAPPSGAKLFKSKCSTCHDFELAMDKFRSERLWHQTITRMKEEHNAKISQEEVDLLVNYHVERQQQESAFFKVKCQKCHSGKVFLEKKLSEDQARAIIRRMQKKTGNTIEDQDIEILVRYHVQAHNTFAEKTPRGTYYQTLDDDPSTKRGMELFMKKCSSCHQADRALTTMKDPKIWAQTIRRMQSYSKGEITDLEAKELVDFHVTVQQRELDAFNETCTNCHDEKRINSQSKSEEQWLETIKRMQQKAPELISDEKVNLLAAYFHRRELTMARIFYNKCQLCHIDQPGLLPSLRGNTAQMNVLITLARREFGRSIQITDVRNLLSTHSGRQKRSMIFYQKDCTICHPEGVSTKKEPGQEMTGKRSRPEWISYISTLQEMEINKETQNTINTRIDYHIFKQAQR